MIVVRKICLHGDKFYREDNAIRTKVEIAEKEGGHVRKRKVKPSVEGVVGVVANNLKKRRVLRVQGRMRPSIPPPLKSHREMMKACCALTKT